MTTLVKAQYLVAWGIFGNLRVRATVGLIWCLVIIGVGHQWWRKWSWTQCGECDGPQVWIIQCTRCNVSGTMYPVHGPQVWIIAEEGASSSLECGPSILPQKPKSSGRDLRIFSCGLFWLIHVQLYKSWTIQGQNLLISACHFYFMKKKITKLNFPGVEYALFWILINGHEWRSCLAEKWCKKWFGLDTQPAESAKNSSRIWQFFISIFESQSLAESDSWANKATMVGK